MTSQESLWFSKLSAERAADAKTFAKPEYRGVWNSVIDKYSDNAHFVYELLQNADDAGATEASFTLVYGKGIAFEHNGSRHFTVSNPDTSKEDQRTGRLGCVNAISAIGQSAKIAEEKIGNQIGKFGIGFKSVFRYTNTPKIYDDNVCFELRDCIVPVLIDDIQGRSRGKTIFCLPFDKGCDLDRISKEIESSILKLQFPLLFLNNLKAVVCRSLDRDGIGQRGCADYHKEVVSDENVSLHQRECIRTRQIRLTETIGTETKVDVVRTMERSDINGRSYAVGFKLDEQGRPVPLLHTKAFCYFQTDVETGLKFLVHAPFKLVENRQGIVNDWDNIALVGLLAQMTADSVLVFKHLGCLDESIFEVIPGCVVNPNSGVGLFGGFPAFFVNLYANEAIYKTDAGYVQLNRAKWPGSQQIKDLLPADLLRELFGGQYVWVHGKCPDVQMCKERVVSLSTALNVFYPQFIERRGVAWLNNLYDLILKNYSLTNSAAVAPIILDAHGRAVGAKDKRGGNAIYLPIETECDFPQVSEELMKQSNAEALFSRFGLRKPSRMDAVKKIITEKIPKTSGRDAYERLIKQVLEFYVESNDSERKEVVEYMRNHRSFAVKVDGGDGKCRLDVVQNTSDAVYFPTELLREYFRDANACFVDLDCYLAMTNKPKDVEFFLEELGARKVVKFWRNNDGEPCVNCCQVNLERMASLTSGLQKNLSLVMWRVLCALIGKKCSDKFSFSSIMMVSSSREGKTLHKLRTTKWIVNNKGDVVAPGEVWVEDLAPEYDLNSWQSQQLIEALQIRRNPELVAIETLTEANRSALELGKRLIDVGLGQDCVADLSQDKIDVLLKIGKVCSEENLKRLLEEQLNGGTSSSIPASASDKSLSLTTSSPMATVSLSDGRMAGLSREEQREVLDEAKRQVEQKLKQEGYVFSQGLGEYGVVNGVMKDGIEYPLVIHSYKDTSRTFQLTAEDWNQLLKPNSMLVVRGADGVFSVPFRDLVCNREKIELSFSTMGNLESKERLSELAHVMRWFKGFHFDFGTLIPARTGTMQPFDLPEQVVDEKEKQRQLSSDDEEGVF